MNPSVGLALVPARNSLILIGLVLRTFSVVVSLSLPSLPGLRHEALPIMSPSNAPDPEVTWNVALTLAPGATCEKVADLAVEPATTAVHPRRWTDTSSFTLSAGELVVFVNVMAACCEDCGMNVWSPGGVAVAVAGVRLSPCAAYWAATMLA